MVLLESDNGKAELHKENAKMMHFCNKGANMIDWNVVNASSDERCVNAGRFDVAENVGGRAEVD